MYPRLVPPTVRPTYDHSEKHSRSNPFGQQATSMRLAPVLLVLLLALPIVFTNIADAPSASASSVQGGPCQATATPEPQEGAAIKEADLAIDGVDLHISTPFLPIWSTSSRFATGSPGDLNQVATASAACPWRILSITAVPFGTTPPVEAVPIAHHGGAREYLASMRQYDKANELIYEPNGPIASLFNQKERSQVRLMKSSALSSGPEPVPAVFVEWVVEAGPRLWIVRAVRELPAGTFDLSSQQPFLRSLERLVLSSNTLDNPSTVITPIAVPGIPPTGIRSLARSADTGASMPDAIVAMVTLMGGLLILCGLVIRRVRYRP